MNSENDLMQKLMISKQIMDKHNNMDRGNSRNIEFRRVFITNGRKL